MATQLRRGSILFSALYASLTFAGSGQAEIAYSPDIALNLDGTVVTDEQVANDDLAGSIALANLGAIPASTEVDAYAADGSELLFSLDTTTLLAGGLTVVPADVVRYDGVVYTLELDAIAEGVPDGANVDAVSMFGSDVVVSFDTTVDLGSGVIAADEDLVAFSAGAVVLLFDGSAAGLDPSLDLDAVTMAAGGAFYASFDQSGSVGGVTFDDDAVVLHSGTTWSPAGDLSDEYAAFGPADLVSVPEPGVGLGLALGAALLTIAARVRRQPTARPRRKSGGV
jgi:hypothetical protein